MQENATNTNRFRSHYIITQVLNLQENWRLLQDTHTTHYSQIKYSRWLSNVSNRDNGIDIQIKFSLSYAWDKEKTVTFKKKENF